MFPENISRERSLRAYLRANLYIYLIFLTETEKRGKNAVYIFVIFRRLKKDCELL